MDRRPLSEGFDVCTSWIFFPADYINYILQGVFDPSRRYGPGEDDHFEADDVSTITHELDSRVF